MFCQRLHEHFQIALFVLHLRRLCYILSISFGLGRFRQGPPQQFSFAARFENEKTTLRIQGCFVIVVVLRRALQSFSALTSLEYYR